MNIGKILSGIVKVAGTVAGSLPVIKNIWYWVKKPEKRIECPRCNGLGEIKAGPDIVVCFRCNGRCTIRESEATKEEIGEAAKRL